MSFSGADPDALAAYAAQSVDAADALRPVDARLATVAPLLARAVPGAPRVTDLVDAFAGLGRRTRALGERVGTFGTKLREALGGPTTKAPMAMQGLLFPGRAGSPPRPVGWERWTPADQTRYLLGADPGLQRLLQGRGLSLGFLAGLVAKGAVNGLAGELDGALGVVTLGRGPRVAVPFDEDGGASFRIARFAGATAAGVAAGEAIGAAVPALGADGAAAFAARRAVDATVSAAVEAGVHPGASPGDLAGAAVAGAALGGALEAAGRAVAARMIDAVDVPTIPHGFDSIEAWESFAGKLHEGLADVGWADARAAVQGSGATGRSFVSGQPFDAGRVSDLDVAIGSERMLRWAEAVGVPLRNGGLRTAPVGARAQRELGVRALLADLSRETGRPVRIMVYRSLDEAVAHKPSIPLPLPRK